MRPKPVYKNSLAIAATVLAFLLAATSALAQTSNFTYQGRLTDGSTAANGTYDLQFALFDNTSGGTQIGSIIGIVPTKVSTENGPIQVGDLLTTSSTPGYAMKALPLRIGKARVYRTGTILGKALESLKEGNGLIKVLVTLR